MRAILQAWGLRLLVPLGLLVVAAFAAAPADAAPEYAVELAADIDPGPGSGAEAFNGSADLGGSIVFTGTTPEAGDEPWISDGTPGGTRLLKDINPGANDGTSVSGYVTFAGRTFFSATDPVNGTELWATDGTPAGTKLVMDFVPGANGSFPAVVGAFRGKLFVVAPSPATGSEFWTVDPDLTVTLTAETVAGTGSVDPQRAQLAGDFIYFTGRTDATGREPWRTTGQSVGPIADVRPGAVGSDPRNELFADGVTFFIADDGAAAGLQIWRTTGSGATKVTNGPSGNQSAGSVLGSQIIFNTSTAGTGSELFTASLAPAPTAPATLLKDINPGAESSQAGSPLDIGGGIGLFAANNGVDGKELWRTDGTANGTTMFSNLNPNGSGSNGNFRKLADGLAVFAGDNGATGPEPYVTDGTPEGTKLLEELVPGAAGSNPSFASDLVGDKQFVIATTPELGRELFVIAPKDVTAPVLTIKAGKKAKKGVVTLQAGCDEVCTIDASGKTKKKVALESNGVPSVAAGTTASLKVAAKGKSKKKLKQLLKGKGKAKIKVTVSATDAAGNEATAKLKVKAT